MSKDSAKNRVKCPGGCRLTEDYEYDYCGLCGKPVYTQTELMEALGLNLEDLCDTLLYEDYHLIDSQVPLLNLEILHGAIKEGDVKVKDLLKIFKKKLKKVFRKIKDSP